MSHKVSAAIESISSLSTHDFYSAVHALNPKVAVFDCDGTLWSGDAGTGFMNWSVETGLLSREAADWLDARYRGYKRGEVSEVAICGEMVQVYQGLRESEVRRAAAQFFASHIERDIFPEMLDLITELRQNGTQIWAVSSTNDWVIEEGVRHFNIPADRVLSARVRTVDGMVTDQLLDVPTDDGKVAALARVGITRPDAVFGNSIHDAAMLATARRAFPVKPYISPCGTECCGELADLLPCLRSKGLRAGRCLLWATQPIRGTAKSNAVRVTSIL